VTFDWEFDWKDGTSYSRGDKDRTPRDWRATIDGMVVIVHRHIHYPGLWLVSCADLGVDTVPLDASEVGAAKREALRFLHDRLKGMMQNFPYPGDPEAAQ
jgi:hypothetical protein